jgi:hypothetical protein
MRVLRTTKKNIEYAMSSNFIGKDSGHGTARHDVDQQSTI